ncbi:MAG: PilZ domain-containing protein [Gammaproteobacteria bacterium]|nr:PilZ domain-containing protein [Gammaproteobacteria bacterium]
MSHKIGDQRKNKRFTSKGNLQSEVIVSDDYPELAGQNIACESINISADGIQILTKDHVPVGTVLDLWVSIPKSKQSTFHLKARICWIKLTKDESSYRAGLDVTESDSNDLHDWYELGFPEKKDNI